MPRDPAQLMRIYLDEVVREGRLERIEEIAWEDMVDEANQAFGGPPGRAGLVAHVVGFRRNVTGLSLAINQIVAGRDAVMAWWSFEGVHSGPWLGRMPTGKAVSGTVFSFFDLRDGRVARYGLWLQASFPEAVTFTTR